DRGSDLHVRKTLLHHGGLHGQPTLLRQASPAPPSGSPLLRRLSGVKLTAAISDTGQLQQIAALRAESWPPTLDKAALEAIPGPGRRRLIAALATAALLVLAVLGWVLLAR